MYSIYVAAHDQKRARRVMDDIERLGHRVAYDWVEKWQDVFLDPVERMSKAMIEERAIQDCDALILLFDSAGTTPMWEAGTARGLDKLIIVSPPDKRDCLFFSLPGVLYATDKSAAYLTITMLKTKKLTQKIP